MQQQFAESASQRVVCASRSRLTPVVSLLGTPGTACWWLRIVLELEATKRICLAVLREAEKVLGVVLLACKVQERVSMAAAGMNFFLKAKPETPPIVAAAIWQLWSGGFRCWVAFAKLLGSGLSGYGVVASAWPNTSLNGSANGRPPGPVRGALHFPQPGPGALPLSPR